ncbi:helix-turn-helix domain-containing protein [Pseudomonas nitroreducens]|uniref:helix-turn-helix domain-containing protein n=1 Tax=Pseudomonas nitroreducens TaxID=46680 RepID=UPI0009DB34AD|nr:helix-turn-helix transcriptional regulator [Pseudomonas nitroreducens]
MSNDGSKPTADRLRRRETGICERLAVLQQIQGDIAERSITLGEAVRVLRVDTLDVTQREFARICKISQRTLVHIESGTGNPTVRTLESIFKKFGLYLTLGRRNPSDPERLKTRDNFQMTLPRTRTDDQSDARGKDP